MGFAGSWRMLVQSFKTGYDHIGKVMLYNILWFALGFSPLLLITYLPLDNNIFFLVSIIAGFVTLGGSTAAVHHAMNKIISGDEVEVKDFWHGFKHFLLRGSLLMLFAALGFGILIFNIWFSANYPSTVFLILAGFWIWGLVYLYSVLQYVFPFLTQQDIGFFLVLKRAALLTLDNPLASTVLVVVSLIVVVLSALLAAPLLIFVASFLAILQNYFYNELMLKYEDVEVDNQSEGQGED